MPLFSTYLLLGKFMGRMGLSGEGNVAARPNNKAVAAPYLKYCQTKSSEL